MQHTTKLLIYGAKGMLGHALARTFKDMPNVLLWDREEMDIANELELAAKIAEAAPEVIINATGYTNVAESEKDGRDVAFIVNGDGVGYLSRAAHAIGATLVHYSTDYVFDGQNQSGYRERDKPQNPLNAYGQSKLLGETLLLAEGAKGLAYYLIRTSWLFGPDGNNFVEIMLRNAQTRGDLTVVCDQHGKPTYTRDLADATRELLFGSYPTGVYHLVNEPATTWFDFACAIFDEYHAIHPQTKKPRVIPSSSADFSQKVMRPEYSVLVNTRRPLLRSWEEALREYLLQRP